MYKLNLLNITTTERLQVWAVLHILAEHDYG
jgi:hypothetical protein